MAHHTSNSDNRQAAAVEQSNEVSNTMDELRTALQDLSTQLTVAIERARRAGYLARRLGLSQVDQHLEDDLLPTLVAFADDDRTATQPGAVGHLLSLLEDDA